MKPATSLYLDLTRFLAAFAVFTVHVGGQRFTGGLFWRLSEAGAPAVSIFFVLSGFVIAHVLTTRERTVADYAASRMGRLYSVVLPALLITAVCDFVGLMRDPESFYSYAGVDPGANVILQYLATAFFANEAWPFPPLEPGSNGPFWSLSFEVAYYCAVGFIVFARGWIRALGLTALLLFSGPAILILSPLWFLGYGVYFLTRRSPLPFYLAVLLWPASLIGIVLSTRLLHISSSIELAALTRIPVTIGSNQMAALLCRYVSAMAFALNLIAFDALAPHLEGALRRVRRSVQFLGSLTFALYLFHKPLSGLFVAYSLGPPSSVAQRIWLIGGTLLIVVTVGRMCENSKSAYKQFFLRVLGVANVHSNREASLPN